MSKTLFPIVTPAGEATRQQNLPLYRDVAWDFEQDRPVFRRGEPVIVTGAEALRVWAYNALKTVRYRHEIWSFDYGCELERLVGQPYAQETKRAEAIRYIQEALLANPYITAVTVSSLDFDGSTFSADVAVSSIYGEVATHV